LTEGRGEAFLKIPVTFSPTWASSSTRVRQQFISLSPPLKNKNKKVLLKCFNQINAYIDPAEVSTKGFLNNLS
jgi:hypothetical protein